MAIVQGIIFIFKKKTKKKQQQQKKQKKQLKVFCSGFGRNQPLLTTMRQLFKSNLLVVLYINIFPLSVFFKKKFIIIIIIIIIFFFVIHDTQTHPIHPSSTVINITLAVNNVSFSVRFPLDK